MINETMKSTRKTINRILANPIAVPAILVKPNTAAMSAITRNVIAQEIIIFFPFVRDLVFKKEFAYRSHIVCMEITNSTKKSNKSG